jgi:hypothetical protein
MTKPSPLQIIQSVFAAFIGVQSESNRIRDFKHGSLYAYIVAGLAVTLLFILAIVTVVAIVIAV